MKGLVDYFNQNPIELDIECFKQSNLSHLESESMELNINIPSNPFTSQKEFIKKFTPHIESEFMREICKKIIHQLFNSKRKSSLDLTVPTQLTQTKRIIDDLKLKKQNHFICNSRIASSIMNSSDFMLSAFSNQIAPNLSMLSKYGFLDGKELWIDPMMKWEDNYILLFEEIKVDISNYEYSIKNFYFSKKISISFDFGFQILDSELFFIFENEFQKNWYEYKQEDRNNKINSILNES